MGNKRSYFFAFADGYLGKRGIMADSTTCVLFFSLSLSELLKFGSERRVQNERSKKAFRYCFDVIFFQGTKMVLFCFVLNHSSCFFLARPFLFFQISNPFPSPFKSSRAPICAPYRIMRSGFCLRLMSGRQD